MASSTPIGSPSPTYTYERVDTKRKDTFISRCTEIYESKTWKPTALRAPVLILTIAICWSLIAVLEFFLWKSQKDSGIIFAPKISDLPLSKTFLYLYFPTIVAVIFSIFWAWIDLETKRMEPYYQLSKKDGALGKDSILLHYPFDFVPFVPLKAFKNGHWPVFWASLAVVLVTWGLVPTQAGIFSVRTVTRTTPITFNVSRDIMPFEQQATKLNLGYTQSAYGIIALNESIPAYMARNYTLAPFAPPVQDDALDAQGDYTASTTMYYLDLYCEEATRLPAGFQGDREYNATNGCSFDLGLDGNATIGDNTGVVIKQYRSMYVGYHNGGFADYYLSSYCPKTENTTFYAALAKSKARKEDRPQPVTAIFCHPRYWQQEVSATVDIRTRSPLKIVPLKKKETLPWNVFNTTNFEAMLNSGSLGVEVRADRLPTTSLPDYRETIARLNINLTMEGSNMQKFSAMPFSMSSVPLADHMDWQILSKAYADAYQILFARAMVDVLGSEFQSVRTTVGQRRISSEAVVLEPVFVHIVVGFLAVVSIATIALLVISFIRERNLKADPSTIASVMALVADNEALLSRFAELDHCTMEDMQKVVGERRYKLVHDGRGANILEIPSIGSVIYEDDRSASTDHSRHTPTSIAKPVRPSELSLWAALSFINLFVVLIIVLAVIFAKARVNGLPLPSSNTIVQNILENYIPTAVATLIEPLWILINRLLCMLQPLEELQDCKAAAKRSIDLNYASLPPQLVAFKALKSSHFILAAVCTMALLANVLAVALSGLFNQDRLGIEYATIFQPPFEARFVAVNGTIGPSSSQTAVSGAYAGGSGDDQYFVAESNFSRNTSMPSWTDDNMFYLPLFQENSTRAVNATQYQALSRGFGAQMNCEPLKRGTNFKAAMVGGDAFSPSSTATMNISIPLGSGSITCYSNRLEIGFAPINSAIGTQKCVSGPSALELVTRVFARPNATQAENDICMGSVIMSWVRDSRGTCGRLLNTTFTEENAAFVHCRPQLVTALGTIRVDTAGRLQEPGYRIQQTILEANNTKGFFTSRPVDVIGQINDYLFFQNPGRWHNDSFTGLYFNYVARKAAGNRRLNDPTQSVPKFEEIVEPVSKAYAKLFAIWLGTNKQRLFIANEVNNNSSVPGTKIELEQRIFVSGTMFIISEAILATYAIVAIWVYLRRPGQYLARLPTSIAAVIALFAASAAVVDMKGTAHMNKEERAKHLEKIDARYGYGSYVSGVDGRVHIGVERTPFVRKKAKTTWLEQRLPRFRKTAVN